MKGKTGRSVESAMAVILPHYLCSGDAEAVAECKLSYVAFTATNIEAAGGAIEFARVPLGSDCLTGSVDDLATAIGFLCRSRKQLRQGANTLERLVGEVAALL